MTTTTTTTDRSVTTPARPPTDPVRRVLAVDAAFCAAAGAVLLAAAAPIADRADLAAPTVVRVIGAFLLVLAVELAISARAPQRWARLGAAVTAVGDLAWVAGSVVLAATAGLPGWATAAVLAQAAATLAVAVAKRAALRASGR